MAFKKEDTILGIGRKFIVSPEARPYTLRDNGFVNTRRGNFQYERSLTSEAGTGLVLKVMVDEALKTLRISTVTPNGLNKIDVSKIENNEMVVEKINFIFDGFVDRDCLVELD